MPDLPLAWLTTCRAVGARGDVAAAGASVLARWVEPHRRYHDARHLAATLDRVDELAAEADHPDVVRLAVWFHDAVYDPRADDNEQRSAALARQVLAGLELEPALVERVSWLVETTRTHEAPEGDADAAVLCDADLAVLAGDPAEYATYVEAIRDEYAHVPDAEFVAGRSAVLGRLRAHDPLFRTTYGRTHWEAPARRNLDMELAQLSG